MAKLYILVRTDLPKNYQAVQAGHAVAEFCKDEARRFRWTGRDVESLPWRWENGTLIYLRGGNIDDINMWNQRLAERGIEFSLFQEPDINNEVTAIAVLSTPEVDKLFSNLLLV